MSKWLLGKEVWTAQEEMLRPGHTALLVVDVQNDFCAPEGALAKRGADVESGQAILQPLSRLMKRARTAGVRIVNLKMTLFSDARTNAPADLARRMAVWDDQPLATIEGTWGHQNPSDLPLADDDWTVRKYRNNGFVGTNLDLMLRGAGIRTLLVTGTATHACVLETCLMAQSLDYYVIVPTDCIASAKHDLHHAGLKVLQAVLHKDAMSDSGTVLDIWSKFLED